MTPKMFAAEIVWREPGKDGKTYLMSDVSLHSTVEEANKWMHEKDDWVAKNGYAWRIEKIYEIEEVKE